MESEIVGPYASGTSTWTGTSRPPAIRAALLKCARYRRDDPAVASFVIDTHE
jgi:hypothetical protein